MRILGIDPGLKITGFGIIDHVLGDARTLNAEVYVASGVMRTKSSDTIAQRIKALFVDVQEILQIYRPDVVSIEKVFVNINPQSTLLLGQARGAILASLSLFHDAIYEYTALQIKQSVTGHGKASKEDVKKMVCRRLNLATLPQTDAADALACAMTHVQHAQSYHKLTFAHADSYNIKNGRLIKKL